MQSKMYQLHFTRNCTKHVSKKSTFILKTGLLLVVQYIATVYAIFSVVNGSLWDRIPDISFNTEYVVEPVYAHCPNIRYLSFCLLQAYITHELTPMWVSKQCALIQYTHTHTFWVLHNYNSPPSVPSTPPSSCPFLMEGVEQRPTASIAVIPPLLQYAE